MVEAIENLQKQDPYHQYLSGICSGRCISDVLQRKILRVCRHYSTSGIVIFGFLVLSLTFLWNNLSGILQKEIFQSDCRPVLGFQKNSQWGFQGKSGI